MSQKVGARIARIPHRLVCRIKCTFYGHDRMQTPRIDQIARQGTLFTQFYSNASVCSPSRCAFLTGQYPARHRIHGHYVKFAEQNAQRGISDWLDPTVPNLASVFRRVARGAGRQDTGMSRPLRIEFPGAIYRSLLDTLRCLANEVVIGLMAVTLGEVRRRPPSMGGAAYRSRGRSTPPNSDSGGEAVRRSKTSDSGIRRPAAARRYAMLSRCMLHQFFDAADQTVDDGQIGLGIEEDSLPGRQGNAVRSVSHGGGERQSRILFGIEGRFALLE
jgi:hypothetical protein